MARLDDQGRPWFLSTGYWNMDEAWRARWRDDWVVTGDAAVRDEDGVHWFVGRHDAVIVTAGINVGPFEIESVLVSHPAVAEEPKGLVRDRVGRHARPAEVRIVPVLPRTGTGKIQRAVLRREAR